MEKTYGTCRFCVEKGEHQELFTEYLSNGNKEIYMDIIMDCFNIYLSINETLSSLICSSCVQQLRNANKFRMTILDSEQKLLNAITDKETVFINVPSSSHPLEDIEDIKTEDIIDVKIENENESMDFDSEYFANNIEDVCDISTKDFQTEVHLNPEEALLARFSSNELKLPTQQSLKTTCPEFFNHLEMLKDKIVLPRMIAKLIETDSSPVKKRKVYMSEKMGYLLNAALLLENSNATPFKNRNCSGYPCYYCRKLYENLDKLREHITQHKKKEIKKILSTFGAEYFVVYVDVTDLKCTICDEKMVNLYELKTHLVNKHKKNYNEEYTDRVIPFKLSEENIYECQVCGFYFETFGSIERHMNVHYRNYVCDECGSGFITKYRLRVHTKSLHESGNYPCDVCKKVYKTAQKLKNHISAVHMSLKRFKCPKCPERFSEYFKRHKHLVDIHNMTPLKYKCNVCEKSFNRKYSLSRHLKRDHLEERDFHCDLCSYSSFTSTELRIHMIKHNGERIYECTVCKKSYARKKTLKEHMRIHNNDRRFACAVCGQAFVQKCSLKGHIKTHHLEYTVQ